MTQNNKNTKQFKTSRGHPKPFGAHLTRTGVNFAIVSESAKNVSLNLYQTCSQKPIAEFVLDPFINKTGDVWHILIHDLEPGIHYNYHVRDDDNSGLYLLDPYSKINCGNEIWGQPVTVIRDNHKRPYRLSTVIDDNFDWEKDQLLNIPLKDTIIYELHIRGFTQHSTSGVNNPGSYKGLVEKIPYLKDLGITEFIILLYFKPEIIQDHFKDGSGFGIKVSYVVPDGDYGTAGAVKLAQELIGDDNFIIVSGDLVTDFDFKKLIDFHKSM